jgi:hypothetical protein
LHPSQFFAREKSLADGFDADSSDWRTKLCDFTELLELIQISMLGENDAYVVSVRSDLRMAWMYSTNAFAIILLIGVCSGKGSVEVFSFYDRWCE